MKGFRRFFTVISTAILLTSLAACSDDNDPVTPPEPEPEPGVTVTAGTSAETTLSFTITPENAEQCAWICIEKQEGVSIPTAEEILTTAGTLLPAIEVTTVEVSDLMPATEYVIVAAASDGKKSVVSEPVAMTTLEKGALVFQSAMAGVFTGNATVTLTEESNAYQLSLDFYYDRDAKWLPAGTYTIGSGASEGMVDNDVSYTYFWLRNEDKVLALSSGAVTVSLDENHVYDITAEFTTDEGEFKAVYKGEIEGFSFSYDFTATSAKRIEINNEIPGEYYLKLNDNNWGYELTLDLFADPSSATLPEGTYTVGTDKVPGTVGPASCIDIYSPSSQERFAAGTVEVTKAENIYTLDIRLANADGYAIVGSFTGEIADMERKPNVTEIAMESADARLYGGYTARNATLKLYKGEDVLELDIYYDINAKYLPAGTYTIGSGSSAGMIDNSPSYTSFTYNGTKLSLTSGTVEIAIIDGLYDIVAEFPTDAGQFRLTYKGAVDGFAMYYDLSATSARRVEVNNEVAGEYYIRLNDTNWKFELALDIFADPASSTLPEGTYTVSAGTDPGSIGPASGIDIYQPFNAQLRFATGTVVVTKAGDVYTFDMNLADADGYELKGQFTGTITDMERM